MLVRLDKYLESKGLPSEKEDNYINIGKIHSFFDAIKERKRVEEQIFKFLIGVKPTRLTPSKEDIKNDFVRYLMLLKKQFKSMALNEGVFFKIFGTRGRQVFEEFCFYIGINYIGQLASDTLKGCLSQRKN